MPAPASARPFLRLVTQTLPDPAGPHGDLEERLQELERFALDFDRYAATPGLRTLATTLNDLTRGLVAEAEGGPLPRQWEKVVSEASGNIVSADDLATRLALVDAACETLEEAGFEDFPDADADARKKWAKEVKETVEALKELRGYVDDTLDNENLVKWVIDQTAYEERAEQWGGLPALLNAAEDGVVARAKGSDADETDDAEAIEDLVPTARVEELQRELDEARKMRTEAEQKRDDALADAEELRAVVANVRRALGDLAASLPGAPEAPESAPPPKPSLPISPGMLAAIETDGVVFDTPTGRYALSASRYFALFHLGITTPDFRVVCALGDPDVGNLQANAETILKYAYATPLRQAVLGKLPKVADAPEDCVAIGLDGGQLAFFNLRMLRSILQGAKHARLSVVPAEGRPDSFALVVLLGSFRGGVLLSRAAPADVTAVPLIGDAVGEEGEHTGPALLPAEKPS